MSRRDNWIMLLDPAWPPADERPPPAEAVVGGWLLDDDGEPGRFHPNPAYQPSARDVPTDPVDAALRLIVAGTVDADALMPTLLDAMVDVALDEQDRPVVAPAPDGVPCVLVVTAAAHRRRVAVERWRQIALPEVVDLLPEGVDVLLNPGGPASTRVLRDALEGGR
ncbi:type VII secretion system-associated protein [Actinocrispum wychmicini]|uniref:Type III secretion system (T3SS) SseB-like protein n=1 Tax=Actinocrispum wychmicini TaxID=1213861 RepID=A0A4V2S6H7_9PSEU|nr:type VII secretion system-associated protein [Actinocrispum wychmicini]TCO56010.1 hypothetical protein EV192_107435 [Actinocrispum wychmicini]